MQPVLHFISFDSDFDPVICIRNFESLWISNYKQFIWKTNRKNPKTFAGKIKTRSKIMCLLQVEKKNWINIKRKVRLTNLYVIYLSSDQFTELQMFLWTIWQSLLWEKKCANETGYERPGIMVTIYSRKCCANKWLNYAAFNQAPYDL